MGSGWRTMLKAGVADEGGVITTASVHFRSESLVPYGFFIVEVKMVSRRHEHDSSMFHNFYRSATGEDCAESPLTMLHLDA